MTEFNTQESGETDQLLKVGSRDDLRLLILSLSQQAQQRIDIFSHDLEHPLFDNEALYEAIKQLAIKSQRTHIHILIQDSQAMIKKGHRLLRLARRISSHITIKVTAKEDRDILKTFILFDNKGYIMQQNSERYEAEAHFNAPLKNKYFAEKFSTMWDRAIIDRSLRRLSL